jgi:hypothetical protein
MEAADVAEGGWRQFDEDETAKGGAAGPLVPLRVCGAFHVLLLV